MKTIAILSVLCFFLIMEISSRTSEDKSDEKSSEECRDSDECESDKNSSSSEEVQTPKEEMVPLALAQKLTLSSYEKCPK